MIKQTKSLLPGCAFTFGSLIVWLFLLPGPGVAQDTRPQAEDSLRTAVDSAITRGVEYLKRFDNLQGDAMNVLILDLINREFELELPGHWLPNYLKVFPQVRRLSLTLYDRSFLDRDKPLPLPEHIDLVQQQPLRLLTDETFLISGAQLSNDMPDLVPDFVRMLRLAARQGEFGVTTTALCLYTTPILEEAKAHNLEDEIDSLHTYVRPLLVALARGDSLLFDAAHLIPEGRPFQEPNLWHNHAYATALLFYATDRLYEGKCPDLGRATAELILKMQFEEEGGWPRYQDDRVANLDATIVSLWALLEIRRHWDQCFKAD